MNRRGGKGRNDRGPRMKDDYGMDDREHSFSSSSIDRIDNRESLRNYDRGGPDRIASSSFEKQNRQDRGGGGASVWMDRNRDRPNAGGQQGRRSTQDGGDMDTNWRRGGGTGNISGSSDHYTEIEGSDAVSHGGGSGNYAENRPSARGSGSRSRGGIRGDRNGTAAGIQDIEGPTRLMGSGGLPTERHNDRQTSRLRVENFADNGDTSKRVGGNRGDSGGGSSNDYRSPSDQSKEGFNAKEIMDWMSQRHNIIIKAFKSQNESKRNGAQTTANEIKMYAPTERCWSQPPIIPSKDDFLQQLERAINQYRAQPGGTFAGPPPLQGNDASNRVSQNRMQTGINPAPRPQNLMHQGISNQVVANMQGHPQFVPAAGISTPQRHSAYPMGASTAALHVQQLPPQMLQNFPQQQHPPSQFAMQQEVVQLHPQAVHAAGLPPGAGAPAIPPQMFQQYLFQQHLMHSQMQQLQSVQMPVSIPPQNNFVTTPHPPPIPPSMSQSIVSSVGGQHMQQSHVPINGQIQGAYLPVNMEHMQSPTAAGFVGATATHASMGNLPTASGTNNYSQCNSNASPKQQLAQSRERGGVKDFESNASTESLGSFREDSVAGNVPSNRQRQDKGASSKQQDIDRSTSRISQQRGGGAGDRRMQDRDSSTHNDRGGVIQRGSWSRPNSKDVILSGSTGVGGNDNTVGNDRDRSSDVATRDKGGNKRIDNNSNSSNNGNRQNCAEQQEGTPQTISNASPLLGTMSSLSGSSKSQRKERNFGNDRETGLGSKAENAEKGGTEKDCTPATASDKETSRGNDLRSADRENRRGSRNYRSNTNSNDNEANTCENAEETTKINNERSTKGGTGGGGNVTQGQKGGRGDRDGKSSNGTAHEGESSYGTVSGDWR